MIETELLRHKTVAITGASSGIGMETARLLAGYGANLVLGSRNRSQLDSLGRELDTKTLILTLDVTEEESVKQFMVESIQRFSYVDVLINCAGTGRFSDALELTPADFDHMVAVNLRGTFMTSQYFGRHMVERGSGHILNVISIAGTTALPGCAGYAASKFGVLGLTRVMQAELRGKGVQVTAVLPGAVHTPFWDSMDQKPDPSLMMPAESIAKHMVYLLCQPRGTVIDEITIMPPLGIL
jgi:3-oxoacyl-[acyl-carrier protein] reductase